ncbi:MAG: threonine synthase [Actinomycetota bacterium]
MVSLNTHLDCARCSKTYGASELHNRCDCGGTLLARYDLSSGVDLAKVRERPGGMWRYRELLPIQGEPVSLGEMQTPLLHLPRISERFGVEVHLKDDGMLPSATFKARGAAVGLTRAAELGVKSLVMPSAGNAGGAWSLYAARAGIPITVTMAATAPRSNQVEVELAGATLELVEGTIADAGRKAKQIAEETGAYLVSTFNEPFRVEGKKTAWLEVFDALGRDGSMRLPGTIITSVGGGVAAVSALKAAQEVTELGWAGLDVPAIVGVQAADCAPVVRAFESGADSAEPWEQISTTIAAGLRVPAPSEGDLVLRTVRDTGGAMIAVTDDEIRTAIADLAASEGVAVCPEGATTLVALQRLAESGTTPRGPVVLYNTGAAAKYLTALG